MFLKVLLGTGGLPPPPLLLLGEGSVRCMGDTAHREMLLLRGQGRHMTGWLVT